MDIFVIRSRDRILIIDIRSGGFRHGYARSVRIAEIKMEPEDTLVSGIAIEMAPFICIVTCGPFRSNLGYLPCRDILFRIVGKGEPVPIRAVFPGAGILKPRITAAAVVEYIVQIDIDIHSMCCVYEVAEIFFRPEIRVDGEIVIDPVTVICLARMDRGKPYRRSSEPVDIVQFRSHPSQIPYIVIVRIRIRKAVDQNLICDVRQFPSVPLQPDRHYIFAFITGKFPSIILSGNFMYGSLRAAGSSGTDKQCRSNSDIFQDTHGNHSSEAAGSTSGTSL